MLYSSEFNRISSSLKKTIETAPYIPSLAFGQSETIDPILVKRVVDFVNNDPDWTDRVVLLQQDPTSETFLASNQKFIAAQEELHHWIAKQESPFTLSSIPVSASSTKSPLLQDSTTHHIVVKRSLPGFLKAGKVNGKLFNTSSGTLLSVSEVGELVSPSEIQFIPDTYHKKLQQQYIESLKVNGVIGKFYYYLLNYLMFEISIHLVRVNKWLCVQYSEYLIQLIFTQH